MPKFYLTLADNFMPIIFHIVEGNLYVLSVIFKYLDGLNFGSKINDLSIF